MRVATQSIDRNGKQKKNAKRKITTMQTENENLSSRLSRQFNLSRSLSLVHNSRAPTQPHAIILHRAF